MSETSKDEIVIYEVMSREVDEACCRKYRTRLEQRSRQKEVVVRAHGVRVL